MKRKNNMEFNEWFKKYEVNLNKEFADDNGQGFVEFCRYKFREENRQ